MIGLPSFSCRPCIHTQEVTFCSSKTSIFVTLLTVDIFTVRSMYHGMHIIIQLQTVGVKKAKVSIY